VTADNGVVYGAALLELDAWVYIYGTEQRGTLRHLHVARAPRSNPEAAWHFWTGQDWSPNAAASQSMLAGVGSQFGVVRLERAVGLVTMDQRRPFSPRIVLYTGDEPSGPWRGPAEIYVAPEADADVAAYDAFVHPQFTRPQGYLISYNLNHVHDPDMLYADATLYRPRFIRADLRRLAARMEKN
jgi:hypothetical protein